MADVLILDDAVDVAAIRDGVIASKLLGDSPLGGSFLATRGFSITFHRAAEDDVVRRFPFLAPFLAMTFAHARAVQRKPLLGGPPEPNALYLNVLVVPPAASVARHVDATLGPPTGTVIPVAVAVLYLDVPADLRGGRLLLYDGDGAEPAHAIEPRERRFVAFAGRLGHEVERVEASRPRMSVVCEQYALAPGVLSAVPRFKVQSRGQAFAAVLDDVRARRG